MMGSFKATIVMLVTLIAGVPQAHSQEVGHLMEELLKPRAAALGEKLGKGDPNTMKLAVEKTKAPKKTLCFVDGHARVQSATKECPNSTPARPALIN